jgi:ComF family protein
MVFAFSPEGIPFWCWKFSSLMDILLDLFFPVSCAGCGVFDRKGLCNSCKGRLPLLPQYFSFPPFSAGLALGTYISPLRDAVLALKFKHCRVVGETLGRLLANRVQKVGWLLDGVVPAPIAQNRWRERGYNHAEVLAKSMATALFLPCFSWLKTTKPTVHQVGLGRKARIDNVSGAFSLSSDATPRGKVLLVVDDVATTGATLSECGRVLKQAGAHLLYAACVALEPFLP